MESLEIRESPGGEPDRRVPRWRFALALCGVLALFLAVHAVAAEDAELQIEIWKSQHRMEVRHGAQILREFDVAFGLAPDGTKQRRGDKRTPVGDYYVTEKHRSGRFHRFLGISYPNIDDADRAYDAGLISAAEWARVFVAIAAGGESAQGTELGGRIGIHGYGPRSYIPTLDWTDGCVAVSNEDAEYLYSTVPVGTLVRIHD